jgi:3-phenylpropionate/trans-cinnamate dioxygenase ferredoxin subunit
MNSEASKATWIPIAKTADPVDRHGTALEIQGEEVALFLIEGCRYATSNVCTHQFALMTDGYVDGAYIACPMHQGRFHIPTGAPQGAPVNKPLRVFPLRIDGDDVLIEFSPSPKI